MKFATVAVTLASTAAAIEWLPIVPLHARQETPGPKFECHEDCGYAILGADLEGYCDNSTWVQLFDGCLDCALEFDIWKHYGTSVTEAAEECNLDATPVAASNETASATPTAEPTADSTSTATPTVSGESATSTTEASGAGFNQPATLVVALAAMLAATQLM
ncbi:hypothetical protein CH063_12909 [Colletotrichum higginsianum]|uniref:Uncharacterized protein n=2 Tax=Colletotrichum higginsianum TaxID=80884 RepID=H1VSA3_COLHI|nr:hypothetical protein CH63R_01650 [Colletotrichum higginsianum IMI 349063]OBR16470.1 hypothetical protein CH63R_01650 [Colletotrichum higginsianum IMI 349063]TID03695.1 hypothetical protein CH35J_001842 [Colletotrichum higginsianum]GJC91297.1 hypothetical protein ColKHC_00123 [Colletotrichum higginsianum]CCF43111.1 hypothetical protein CH063_12909 [Colletotrichum higginsianum]